MGLIPRCSYPVRGAEYGQRTVSFSQAQGYEEIPEPLKLEELPKDAWTRIWNLFFLHHRKSKSTGLSGRPGWIRGSTVSGRPCRHPGVRGWRVTMTASTTATRPTRQEYTKKTV